MFVCINIFDNSFHLVHFLATVQENHKIASCFNNDNIDLLINDVQFFAMPLFMHCLEMNLKMMVRSVMHINVHMIHTHAVVKIRFLHMGLDFAEC